MRVQLRVNVKFESSQEKITEEGRQKRLLFFVCQFLKKVLEYKKW